MTFVHCFQGEWLKTRRSLAMWIAIIGGLFAPSVITLVRLLHPEALPVAYAAEDFWIRLWRTAWESMAIFLLPFGIILTTSVMTQIEFKNNTWKQVHTLPLHLTTIFFAKLAVIVLIVLLLFLVFNVGIYVSALVPCLLIGGVPYPSAPIPVADFLIENGLYFVDCLPILALQYLLSLRYKNFLVPVGIGAVLWVCALSSLSWNYGYVVPYTYTMFNFLKGETLGNAAMPTVNFHLLALGYFGVITGASLVLYMTNKEKG